MRLSHIAAIAGSAATHAVITMCANFNYCEAVATRIMDHASHRISGGIIEDSRVTIVDRRGHAQCVDNSFLVGGVVGTIAGISLYTFGCLANMPLCIAAGGVTVGVSLLASRALIGE